MYMTECYNYSPDSHWDAICQKCPVCKINQPCNSFPLCIRVPGKLMSNMQTIWKKISTLYFNFTLQSAAKKWCKNYIYYPHDLNAMEKLPMTDDKMPYAPRGHCPQNAHKARPKARFGVCFCHILAAGLYPSTPSQGNGQGGFSSVHQKLMIGWSPMSHLIYLLLFHK